MKKWLLAVLLAMALCLGLCVGPAFAAGSSADRATISSEIASYIGDRTGSFTEKGATFSDTFGYQWIGYLAPSGDPSLYELEAYTLPDNATITFHLEEASTMVLGIYTFNSEGSENAGALIFSTDFQDSTVLDLTAGDHTFTLARFREYLPAFEAFDLLYISINGTPFGDNIIFAAESDLPTNTAYANAQTVLLDGNRVEFQAYALKDDNGNLTNYIKLRDLAWYLNGTPAQFSVDWNLVQGISLNSGKAYSPNGSELSTPFSGNQPFERFSVLTVVNKKLLDLDTISLDNGGYTYYKLRDLGRALHFNVSYINGQIVINTNEPYSDAQ